MTNKKSLIIVILIFVCVAVISFAAIFWVTVNGVGVSPDSTIYISTAKSLLEGKGFYVGENPMTHYPPFYPIILSIGGLFNPDISTSARWINSLIYCANAILLGLMIYLGTRRNLAALIFGLLFFFGSPTVLTIHQYAWSEAPFIMLSLISFLLIFFYFKNRRWIFLVLSSIVLGLAIATRYVGIALLPPVLICLLFYIKQPVKKKIRDILSITLLALLPIVLWMTRNLIISGSTANRSFIFHPIAPWKFKSLILTLHNFILPTSGFVWMDALELSAILFIFLYACIVLIKKRKLIDQSGSVYTAFIPLGVLFTITYILVLIFSISFIDAGTQMDERILSPVLLFLSISIFPMIFFFSKLVQKKYIWIIFLLFVAFSIRTKIPTLKINVNEFHFNGSGYNTKEWNESKSISFLKTIPPGIIVYSNGADVIRYKTGIDAVFVPEIESFVTNARNEHLNEDIISMCNDVEDGKAIIVFLDNLCCDVFLSTEKQFLEKCNPPVLFTAGDGVFYGVLDK